MFQTIAFMCVLTTGATAELSGRVVDQMDQPIVGAIVVISTAKPRVGPATTCPSCYRDCAKRSRTDAEGRFVFEGLSSELLFRLAAGAADYQGSVSEHFDPAAQAEIKLMLKPLSDAAGVTRAVGSVVDQQGNPIAGAEVYGRTIYRSNGSIGGTDPSVAPLTLTDADGKFQVTTGDHIQALDLRVTASGYAPSELQWRRTTRENLTFELGPGASIRGRLTLDDGAPLASVEVGIVQDDRGIGSIVTPGAVSTDSNGIFQFDQLPPDLDYAIYTHTGQNARGILPVSFVRAPAHGQRADLGDIATEKPHRLAIMVRTDDGSPLPADSSVNIGRYRAWEGSWLPLPRMPAASIRLNDVGKEMFSISIRVPGFTVVKTVPLMNMDLNQRYGIRITGDTHVLFVMQKSGDPAPRPAQNPRADNPAL